MARLPDKFPSASVVPVKPNLLQMDLPPDIQDHSTQVSLRCPHCMQIGMFQNALHRVLVYHKAMEGPTIPKGKALGQFLAALRVCPNEECRGLVFVVQNSSTVLKALPSPRLDFSPDGIPPKLVATLKEAIDCHSSEAYRATALMVRRLMEEICDEHGASGANLHQRLTNLKDKVPLSIALLDGAMELKLLGNDAAHVTAKEYAAIGKEEAELSIEVAKEILKALYQHKALVDRLQKLKGGKASPNNP